MGSGRSRFPSCHQTWRAGTYDPKDPVVVSCLLIGVNGWFKVCFLVKLIFNGPVDDFLRFPVDVPLTGSIETDISLGDAVP